MSRWSIGISTGMFYHTSFFDCIDPLLKAGFDLVEICSAQGHLDYHSTKDVQAADRLLKERKITPYSFHAPFREEIDITSKETEHREYAIQEIKSAIAAAANLKAKFFVFHPGPEKPPEGDAAFRNQRKETALASLHRILDHCREKGLILVLENLLPHLFGGRQEELEWLLNALNEPDISVCLDTGHAYLGGRLEKMINAFASRLQMIHVNDNRGDGDQHLAPPTGMINWRQCLNNLQKINFKGTLILELAPIKNKSMSQNLKDARLAKEYLEQQM